MPPSRVFPDAERVFEPIRHVAWATCRIARQDGSGAAAYGAGAVTP